MKRHRSYAASTEDPSRLSTNKYVTILVTLETPGFFAHCEAGFAGEVVAGLAAVVALSAPVAGLARAASRRRDQELLGIIRRAKAVRSAREVALGVLTCRYMPGLAKTRFAGQRQHLGWSEEADEACPACSRALLRELKPRTRLGIRELERQ